MVSAAGPDRSLSPSAPPSAAGVRSARINALRVCLQLTIFPQCLEELVTAADFSVGGVMFLLLVPDC